MTGHRNLQIGQLCERLDVPVRHARYFMEQGLLPPGVDPAPDRGNHRQLDPAQAFWLAIALKLKQAGLSAALAAEIAGLAETAFRPLADGLSQDPTYHPSNTLLQRIQKGGLTPHWYVEVGDLVVVRNVQQFGVLTANSEPWCDARTGEPRPGINPIVVIRLDLTELARLLRGSFAESTRDMDGR